MTPEVVVKQSNKDVQYYVNYAAIRLKTGARYGDDMRSSAVLCYQDAINLLTMAKDKLEIEINDEIKEDVNHYFGE